MRQVRGPSSSKGVPPPSTPPPGRRSSTPVPGRPSSGGNGLANSLLGSDAYLQTGRARRIPPSTKKKPVGPLLNCTSESRRRATMMTSALLRSVDASLLEDDDDDESWWSGPRQASEVVSVGVAGVALTLYFAGGLPLGAAAGTAFLATLCWLAVLLSTSMARRVMKKRRSSAVEEKQVVSGGGTWQEFWPTQERTPPLPLAKLPTDRIEDLVEEWMVQNKVANRWTHMEARFLKRARREHAAEFATVPMYMDAYGDRRLLRVLRQDPRRDEDKAVQRIGEYLAWRKSSGTDEMRARLLDSQGEPRPPAEWPHGEMLMACIRVLQTSTDLFDLNGNSVTVYQAFHWPAAALKRQLCSLSTKELVEFAQYGAEFNAVQLDRIALARETLMLAKAQERLKQGKGLPEALKRDGWGELTRLCAVTDMAGCTFGSLMMPTLLPAFVQAVSTFINFYPCIVGDLHVVNCAPVIARILRKTLGSVVPRHIAEQVKVHINSTGLQSPIQYVSSSNLPVQIGGDHECPLLTPPDPPPPR